MRRFLRRLLRTAVAGWLVAVLLVAAAGVGYALFHIDKPVIGIVTAGTVDVVYERGSASTIASNGICVASVTNQDSLEFTWTGGFPGDWCNISLRFQSPATSGASVGLVHFNLATDTGYEALVATLGPFCGTILDPGATVGVTVHLVMAEGVEPGTTFHVIDGSAFVWELAPIDMSMCE